MKRLFSLLVIFCMLISSVAFAENAEDNAVWQDEMPPMLVTSVNEEGETIVARICDKDGNVIAEIKDDGSIILTDVHMREKSENGIIVARLTKAYEEVMADVHHSDVKCELHDHDVKVDVDTDLASIDAEMDSHDLVMYEMFDVMLAEEIEGMLVDGNYLEMTLELLVKDQHVPLITLFTGDGDEWKVIQSIAVDEKRFTLHLTESGTVALLNDGRETMGIGQSVQRVVAEIPGEQMGEYAIDVSKFTPSVSGKTAPQMITFTGEDGEVYIGYIRNDTGDMEIAVADRNYILITAVAERDYVVDIQTHEHLEWSYDSILEVEDVGELFAGHDENEIIPDSEHMTIADALDNILAEMDCDLTHDQLVVKDLFEVSAYGDYLHYLYDEYYYLEVTFDTSFDADEPLVVIHSPDSKHWSVLANEDVRVNSDGTVTLKMYDLGSFAFLVEAKEDITGEAAVQSPN